MTNIFGDTLRRARLDAGLGLRELARRIDKSPGYLSDVENGHVPPPTEAVIIDLAETLGVGRQRLLAAARKMEPELTDYVARRPEAADFLRMARDRGFERGDWERLIRLAEIADLGRTEKNRK